MQHFFFGSSQFYFRRALLEQQNAARAGQMQSMNSLGSALMSGGNVMNTPQAPRGLTSMSPAPQQLSRPRKILSLHDYYFYLFFLLSTINHHIVFENHRKSRIQQFRMDQN